MQSGVVKVEGGTRGAIPDHEEKGLEEVHVRGGRSGEIAYLIDGMYIRNPIYGGIGRYGGNFPPYLRFEILSGENSPPP